MDKDNLDIEEILVDKPSEEDLREVPLDDSVFYYFLGIVFLVGCVVLFQVFRIGTINKDIYTEAAVANRTEIRHQESPRGLIKGKFGNPLLENTQDFEVRLLASELPAEPDKKSDLLKKIAKNLEINFQDLKNRLKDYQWSLGPPVLKHSLSHKELINLKTKEIRGIKVESGFQRTYSNPFAFSHILGYVGPVTEKDLKQNKKLRLQEDVGKAGLELEYDSWLRGKEGKRVKFMNALGEIKGSRLVEKPKSGSDLKTSIDSEMQKVLYKNLKDRLKIINSNSAVGIAMNPQNGSILSMVSLPSYNLKKIEDYLHEPNNPLFNKAIKGQYNPGSTIKPLVALAALEEGIVNPETRFYSPGYLKVENPYFPNQFSTFKDWRPHGWVDIKEALARSSNVYFYILGGGHDKNSLYGIQKDRSGLGINKLKEWWSHFNLGSKTGIDLPGENEGVLPGPEWKKKHIGSSWRLGDTYNVSIGQGSFAITPLSLLNYISTIGNGGTLYRPNIAQKRQKKVVKDLSKIISKDNLEQVKEGMENTVDKPYGTAHNLSYLDMNIAAKTGSAEVGEKSVNALFVGFAPVKKPQIALLILIEKSPEGSLDAVPVAGDFFEWYCKNRLKQCSI
ncbi:MAG: peptidoglycan D,D-transpeptidase FtsI family protein [Candidatus Magasanikbacteria bacterium]